MKILRVISSVDLRNGGPINGLMATTPLLIAMGHDVEILTLDDSDAKFLDGFPFKLYAFDDVLSSFRLSLKASDWLDENIGKYDAVIIHGIWQYHSYAAAKACVKKNVPYVLFTHGMLDPWFNKSSGLKYFKKVIYWRFFESFVVKNAAKVLFTSETEKELSAQSFSPYSADAFVVSYGSPRPSVGNNAAELFLKANTVFQGRNFILFMSRIHPKKGLDLILYSLPELLKENPDFMLAVAGPDSDGERARLEAVTVELGVSNNVFWLGMLEGEQKWGALYAASAFALFSHQENFGIAVSEALSTATPVLISDQVNICKLVESAGAGLVCPDNQESVLKCLKSWIGLDDRAKAVMSDSAMELYLSRFSIEAAAKSIDEVLKMVTE